MSETELYYARMSGKARLYQEYENATETADIDVGGTIYKVNGSLVDYGRFNALERAVKVRGLETVHFRDADGTICALTATDYSLLVDGLACAGVDADTRLQSCYAQIDQCTTLEEINAIKF